MKLLELAHRIHQKIGNPQTPVVGAIQYWLRFSVGTVNNLISTAFTLNTSSGDVNEDITESQSSIFEKLYFVYYYNLKAQETLGAAAFDPVMEVAENGQVVRLINRNEVSKSYIQLRNAEKQMLDELVYAYQRNASEPVSVDGEDTSEEDYNPRVRNWLRND